MTLRSNLTLVAGIGLLAFVTGTTSSRGQDEPRLEIEGIEQDGEARRPDRGGVPLERLRNELNELRRMLEEERAARRRAEARAERSRAEEERSRYESQDREGRSRNQARERIELEIVERPGAEDRETPGMVQVAEAKVRAARAALEFAELRAEATRRKLESTERLDRERSEADTFAVRLAVAEAEAAVAEARARLVESEFNLARARRAAEKDGEDAVVKVESEFTVDDALETADKVIDIIRGFRFDDRPR